MIPAGSPRAPAGAPSAHGHVVDGKVAVRRLVGFFGGVTLVNVIVGTQATYRAVEHMETVQFCGRPAT